MTQSSPSYVPVHQSMYTELHYITLYFMGSKCSYIPLYLCLCSSLSLLSMTEFTFLHSSLSEYTKFHYIPLYLWDQNAALFILDCPSSLSFPVSFLDSFINGSKTEFNFLCTSLSEYIQFQHVILYNYTCMNLWAAQELTTNPTTQHNTTQQNLTQLIPTQPNLTQPNTSTVKPNATQPKYNKTHPDLTQEYPTQSNPT